MTAAELEAHPEFPHVTWDLKPTKKGRIPVAAKRGGPLNISYEVHGNGPRKIVVCFLILLCILSVRGIRSSVVDQYYVLGQPCIMFDPGSHCLGGARFESAVRPRNIAA
jgi:hypothetical protein